MTMRPCAGALKRAEWVKFLAPFFNRETVANAYFAGVEAAYKATKVGYVPRLRFAPILLLEVVGRGRDLGCASGRRGPYRAPVSNRGTISKLRQSAAERGGAVRRSRTS